MTGMTIGHSILIDQDRYNALPPGKQAAFIRHELAHVYQYELFGGIPFLTLYGGASLLAHLGGGDYYADNIFEKQADEHRNGSLPEPLTSWPEF